MEHEGSESLLEKYYVSVWSLVRKYIILPWILNGYGFHICVLNFQR